VAHSIELSPNGLVAMTRDSLLALRSALFREMGGNAALLLQEAGISGGPALYQAFTRSLAHRGHGAPESLPAAVFAQRATEFFQETGWGSVSIGSLDTVATVDSPDWSEGDPSYPLEFPGCYYTSGMFADFFGRLAGEPLAVMEVECRSMGAARCRFLVGSSELMQKVYDEMGRGVPYEEVVGAGIDKLAV
jgi:uncharacterized protein